MSENTAQFPPSLHPSILPHSLDLLAVSSSLSFPPSSFSPSLHPLNPGCVQWVRTKLSAPAALLSEQRVSKGQRSKERRAVPVGKCSLIGQLSTCSVALPPFLVKRARWYLPSLMSVVSSFTLMSTVPMLNVTPTLPWSCKQERTHRGEILLIKSGDFISFSRHFNPKWHTNGCREYSRRSRIRSK